MSRHRDWWRYMPKWEDGPTDSGTWIKFQKHTFDKKLWIDVTCVLPPIKNVDVYCLLTIHVQMRNSLICKLYNINYNLESSEDASASMSFDFYFFQQLDIVIGFLPTINEQK